MSQPMDSKSAAQALIDPFNEPEPSAETGPGAHFGSTFAAQKPDSPSNLSSNNPFKSGQDSAYPQPGASSKDGGARSHVRQVSGSENRPSSREKFPGYRGEAFGDFNDAPARRSGDRARSGATPPAYHEVAGVGSSSGEGRRRTSSLTARHPGDHSHEPLNMMRKASRKADRSPHLKKHHMPGADSIDRLDPAVGGRAYHHEGPYDAAMLARNTSYKNAPIAALETSNNEALKATPNENIKDSLNKHVPLEGTAAIPPGEEDRLGRRLNYEEGTDMMREGAMTNAGYKRYPGVEYDPEDKEGQGPSFSLDRALQAHKIDDNGIEMSDRSGIDRAYHRAERDGSLDKRDPVAIAGDEGKYTDLQHANDTKHSASAISTGVAPQTDRSPSPSGFRAGLKEKIGNLTHRRHGSRE